MNSGNVNIGKFTAWVILGLALGTATQMVARAIGRREGVHWLDDDSPRSNDTSQETAPGTPDSSDTPPPPPGFVASGSISEPDGD